MDEQIKDERLNIQVALEQLVTAMKNSKEYIRFKKAEAKVAEFSGLQQRIDEFTSALRKYIL